MSKTYSELLKDPRWKKKRTEILIRDKYTCMHCSATGVVLHVHHEKYDGLPWEVSNRYLKTLCEKCHGLIHKEGKRNLSFRQPSQVRGILLSAMKKSNISYIVFAMSSGGFGTTHYQNTTNDNRKHRLTKYHSTRHYL